MAEMLDNIDKIILSELDKNCRLPASKLAKKVGKSREAVKYRVKQLRAKGVIRKFITSVNPSKMGYSLFKAYLQLDNIPEERERFYEYLKDRKDVYWLGISDGVFDCVFSILSKNINNYYGEINGILSKFKHLIINKVLGTMVDAIQYNKKFFTGEKKSTCSIIGGDVIKNVFDEKDFKILNILANDARIPLTELSRKVGLTVEVSRGKVKKMEKLGVIQGYRIDVDLNKIGYEFFKAIVYFKSLSKEDERAIQEWMSKNPYSLYYIRSLAPWEAELEFAVENYQHFNSIINELRKAFPTVIRNHEHIIMIYETWLPAFIENQEISKTKNKDKLTP